ncbi:MAG: Rieske 2Fe-2S domain-containing protein [Rhodobiaceae bacterium]|nr:Rieske 2Fe-2S domain-containing protein [Rhodobiaceae bacterium]
MPDTGPVQKDAQKHNPNNLPMRVAAVYERVIDANLARAWENVLDWEHLPHLHDSSFSSLELEDAGEWGWRARTKGVPQETSQETLIELVVDRPNSRYVSRTLAGGLPGMEIWTHFTKVDERKTQIKVEFHIPNVDEDGAAKLGGLMLGLYETLWDEDERMMVERQAALDAKTAPNQTAEEPLIDLGDLEALNAHLPLTIELAGKPVNIVRIDDALHAYSAECPHMLAPLSDVPVDNQGCITCPWHGYRFDVKSGKVTNGKNLSLSPGFEVTVTKDNRVEISQT